MSDRHRIALLLTSGIPVYGMPKSYVEGFGRGLWLDLPTTFYLAAAVVAAIWVMQNYTRMGQLHPGHWRQHPSRDRLRRAVAANDLPHPLVCDLLNAGLGIRAGVDEANRIGPSGDFQRPTDAGKHRGGGDCMASASKAGSDGSRWWRWAPSFFSH